MTTIVMIKDLQGTLDLLAHTVDSTRSNFCINGIHIAFCVKVNNRLDKNNRTMRILHVTGVPNVTDPLLRLRMCWLVTK